MDQHFCQDVGVALIADRMTGQRAPPFLSTSSGGTRTMPRLDAGVGLDPAAINADLAGAQQLLQMAEAEPGKWVLNQRSSRMPASPASQ
jgi:hypothetical protein